VDYLLSAAAVADIIDWSEEHFGVGAAGRYQALVDQAILDTADDPRQESLRRPGLGEDVYAWHLRRSRDRVSGAKVRAPRHIFAYRIMGDLVQIGLLHDRMDLARHLSSAKTSGS
jgi:toxin ParE1/3/4